jgi:hypothetical protein
MEHANGAAFGDREELRTSGTRGCTRSVAAGRSDPVHETTEARGRQASEAFERADLGRVRPEDIDLDTNVWRFHQWRRWVAHLR